MSQITWIARAVALFLLLAALRADAYWDEFTLDTAQFSGYKPMYVLWGSPDAKIQLSLKVRVVRDWNLYFAYSQLMLWETTALSHPFRDLNYNPVLFYRWRPFERPERWVDVGFFEHESNGLDGTGSREWERIYLLIADTEELGGPFRLHGSFKAWIPYHLDGPTPDFVHYRGLCELNLTLSNPFGKWLEGSSLTLRWYPAGSYYFDPLGGGQELTLEVKAFDTSYLPKITFQVFHGYGEYMLDYNQEHWRGYIGLAF